MMQGATETTAEQERVDKIIKVLEEAPSDRISVDGEGDDRFFTYFLRDEKGFTPENGPYSIMVYGNRIKIKQNGDLIAEYVSIHVGRNIGKVYADLEEKVSSAKSSKLEASLSSFDSMLAKQTSF